MTLLWILSPPTHFERESYGLDDESFYLLRLRRTLRGDMEHVLAQLERVWVEVEPGVVRFPCDDLLSCYKRHPP